MRDVKERTEQNRKEKKRTEPNHAANHMEHPGLAVMYPNLYPFRISRFVNADNFNL